MELLFIEEPLYIHQVQEKFENITLNEKIDEVVEDDDEIPHDKVILSIDIGIHHLGLSAGYVDKGWKLLEITWVDMVDITQFTHNLVDNCDCKLYHGNTIADRMEHIFQEYYPVFNEADYILIERQPINGLVAVEQIIYYRWREKCCLVSPRSMHKHFCIGSYDYEQRKQRTMYFAERQIWHERAIQRYQSFERKHDISDSICIMVFWLAKRRQTYIEQKHKEEVSKIKMTAFGFENIDDWLQQFRYVPL